MQIVINIHEKDYQSMKNGHIPYSVLSAIMKGTPLPKGHGKLIDADELYDGFIDGTEGYDCQTWSRIEIGDIIEDAPTIIEADDTESEGRNDRRRSN